MSRFAFDISMPSEAATTTKQDEAGRKRTSWKFLFSTGMTIAAELEDTARAEKKISHFSFQNPE